MGGKTTAQRVAATNQPYTRSFSDNGGQTYQVFGYTPERTEKGIEWQEHDLGSDFSLDASREVAADWKQARVNVYPTD